MLIYLKPDTMLHSYGLPEKLHNICRMCPYLGTAKFQIGAKGSIIYGWTEAIIQFMKWNEYVIEKIENTIKAQTAYWNLVSCEEAMGE